MSIKGKGYSEEIPIETAISKSCLFLCVFYFLELRFRTTARDIPPFLPQCFGLEWAFMDLGGLEP